MNAGIVAGPLLVTFAPAAQNIGITCSADDIAAIEGLHQTDGAAACSNVGLTATGRYRVRSGTSRSQLRKHARHTEGGLPRRRGIRAWPPAGALTSLSHSN